MIDLTGKVAVVTGGSRGIGFAIARRLRKQGAAVVIAGTREQSVSRAVRELQGAGGDSDVLGVRADVQYADVENLIETSVRKFGGVDVLVNNAGVGLWCAVADMSVEQWQRVIETNLTGVFYCCRAALPHLRARGGGWIINISSLAGKNPFAEGAAYCASKSALNAFSESLMQEVRHEGVRVAYVMPGSVRTDFSGPSRTTDDWKLAPDDVAEVVVDLLAHPSRSLPSRVEIRPAQPPRKG
jgi:NAD(P)-dependent dehydrogenase (short-subunit alcohol dehydrogenase family)